MQPYGSEAGASYAQGSQAEQTSQMGQRLAPIFCVSVHEHAWMSAGLGIWGKEDYLKRFWTVLDWKKVSDAYMKLYKSKPKNPEYGL